MPAIRSRHLAFAVLLLVLSACTPVKREAVYRVTELRGRETCIARVSGHLAGERICGVFPRISANRPLRIGDCVLLTWFAEAGGTSRLHLKPDAFCTSRV